jgi:hypothetical protein
VRVGHSWHRLARYSLADIVFVVSNYNINIDHPQAPGSHGQISANHFTEDLWAIHGTDWLIFPCSSTHLPVST